MKGLQYMNAVQAIFVCHRSGLLSWTPEQRSQPLVWGKHHSLMIKVHMHMHLDHAYEY